MRTHPFLFAQDPEIWELIQKEHQRQTDGLELIASENFASPAVIEALGNCLTNKYAEGYPGKRYYGGCEVVDEVEELARKRACAIFGAEHANVQPHSGSQANMAAYLHLINPGDTVLGMDLSQGGHLTHGSPVNFSGQYFKFFHYGVDPESELLNYQTVEKLAQTHKPKLIVAGASAYSRLIDFKKFKEIADSVSALLLVDMAHIAGLVAAGLHPNPIPFADVTTTTTHKTLRGPRGGLILTHKSQAKGIDKALFPGAQGGPLLHVIAAKAVCFKECLEEEFKNYGKQVIANAQALASSLQRLGLRIVSGGTDNHLFNVDLTDTGHTGKEIECALGKALITVNKNTIPRETRSPFVTSGIRIGTPALTTRGMKSKEMEKIAEFIFKVIQSPADEKSLVSIKNEVQKLSGHFPYFQNFQNL